MSKIQDSMPGTPLFPVFLYVYELDGSRGAPVEIPNEQELCSLKPVVKQAVGEGRTVIMTDPADNCVFHAEAGEIIFPTKEMVWNS